MSSSYGLGYELEMKREWLIKAYEWLDPTRALSTLKGTGVSISFSNTTASTGFRIGDGITKRQQDSYLPVNSFMTMLPCSLNNGVT